MKTLSKVVTIIVLLILTACSTNKTITEFSPQKKYFYSLKEYETAHGTKSKFIGDERIKILKDNTLMGKKYKYAIENSKIIVINQSVNSIADTLKSEEFFDKHKKYLNRLMHLLFLE